VEPVTHALTSLALARAGRKQLPRFGTAMLVVAGIAPDLDYASYLGGASSFLRFDRTLLHSLPSSVALAAVIAGTFCWFIRRHEANQGEAEAGTRLQFGAAFAVCAIGIAGHLLFDVASGVGVRLLWPFRARWFALDLLTELDPWILILLGAGLLLPALFRLVGEEIGEKKNSAGGGLGAVVTLILVLAYVGALGFLHSRAVDLLETRDYHGRTPLAAGAFPEAASPLEWRGVVSTDNTIEEVEVSLKPGSEFDPEHSVTHYKPDESPALESGQHTATAQRFLSYARFPLASVVRAEQGYRFELRDERFADRDGSPANIRVLVEMRGDLQIMNEEFEFESSRR
jgi:inner membrane protein